MKPALMAEEGPVGNAEALAAGGPGHQAESAIGPLSVPANKTSYTLEKSRQSPGQRGATSHRGEGSRCASARRQNHHDLTPFETGVLFDLGKFGYVRLDLVEELGADFLMGHFAAAVTQGNLDLVAFFEEALHSAHLHVVVMIVDHRPQLDLLDLDDFLFLASSRGLLLRRIFELPVVHD